MRMSHATRSVGRVVAAAIAAVGLFGLTIAAATVSSAATATEVPAGVTAGVATGVAASCGDDTREDDWVWWKDPKPKPCYRYTFDTPGDDVNGDAGGPPPKDAGQGGGGRPEVVSDGAAGGSGTDAGAQGGAGSNSGGGGVGQEAGSGGSGQTPTRGGGSPAAAGGASAGSGVAGPVTVTDTADTATEMPGSPDPSASSDEAVAAGIDLTGGGPQPRTLLPWLPAGAFWGAVAVLIAGLASLAAYFLRRT